MAVEVTALKVSAQKVAPNTATVSPLEVSGRIAAGRSDPGKFGYKGNLVLQPISAEGRLEVGSFPAHAFKAYYADALNVDIRRAFASYRGTVQVCADPAERDEREGGGRRWRSTTSAPTASNSPSRPASIAPTTSC